MPARWKPQLCDTAAEPPKGPGWVHEIKFDGYRTLVFFEAGKVRLVTRNGLDWTARYGALARALADEGAKLRGSGHGFTRSHQVLLDCTFEEAKVLSRRLEKANIITDDGGRIGTSEVTRMGYGPKEMEKIAILLADVLSRRRSPVKVGKEVQTLVRDFQKPRFVLRSVPRIS
jgi:hypothetical protein